MNVNFILVKTYENNLEYRTLSYKQWFVGVADFLGDKSSLFIQVKAVYTQNKKQKREKMLYMHHCKCIFQPYTIWRTFSKNTEKKEWHFVKTDINNMELYNNSGCYTHFYPLPLSWKLL